MAYPRNKPCPCGSGRKYKLCCEKTEPRAVRYSAADRLSALSKLQALSDSAELEEEDIDAEDQWWGDLEPDSTDIDKNRLLMIDDAYEGWFTFDRPLSDGRRPAERLLAEDATITPGERAWLEAGLASSMELYEVVDVTRGSSLTVRHTLSRQQFVIWERAGSQTIRPRDVLAARIFAAGAREFQFDRGLYPLPRTALLQLTDQLQSWREEHVASRDPLPFSALLPPYFHQLWVGPFFGRGLPTMQGPDGEVMLLTTLRFSSKDGTQVRAALDDAPELEQNSSEDGWIWRGEDGAGPQPFPTFLKLRGGHLVVEAFTQKQARRCRTLVERVCGAAVEHRSTVHEDLGQKAMRDGPPPPREVTPEEESLTLEHYEEHSRKWLDMDIPALGGLTPRRAARGAMRERDRLATLLGDITHQYEQALLQQDPAYDPTWMWEALGMEEHRDAPAHHAHPPILGHELACQRIEGLEETARIIADRRREEPGFTPSVVLTHEELEQDLGLTRAAKAAALRFIEEGGSPTDAPTEAGIFAAHAEYLANLLLHRRKIFWVDPSVAWMLGHTRADFESDQLALPFASFALAYTDRYTLGLAEKLASADPTCGCRGRLMSSLTACVTRIPGEDGDAGLRIALLCVYSPREWPWLLVRDLPITPGRKLDRILDGRFEELEGRKRDPIFDSLRLRTLLEVVLNSILYATSAGVEPSLRTPPVRSSRVGGARALPPSSEEVWFLPGKIDISALRALQAKQREGGGGQLTHRFMVRGHWRRAAKTWKDQRQRWVEPYWKGPDMAAIVEREYRLRE